MTKAESTCPFMRLKQKMGLAPESAALGVKAPVLKISLFDSLETIVGKLTRFFEEGGDVAQLKGGPMRVFCFRHPDHVMGIYKLPAINTRKQPKLLSRVKLMMGEGTYILSGQDDWRRKRRSVQVAFGEGTLGFDKIVAEGTNRLLDRWASSGQQAWTGDVYREMRQLITDISFRLLFSADITDRLPAFQEETHFFERSFGLVSPLWLPLRRNFQFRRRAKEFRKLLSELVAARRKTPDAPRDVLSSLIELKDEATQKPWSDDRIVDEALAIYFGASVMSITLTWTLCSLARHPAVYQRFREEVAAVVGDRTPTAADVPSLAYGRMALNEVTRLFPASWGYPRYAEWAVTIGGIHVPADSIVISMVYHTHRHPSFWEQPEHFDPDRFSPEKENTLHPLAHFPFGGGPRTCLGMSLAPKIMALSLARIAQKFRPVMKPRFAGDPVIDFGFEIAPKDQVFMEMRASSLTNATVAEKYGIGGSYVNSRKK